MNQNKENLFALVKNKTLKGNAIINLAILYIADLILHFYYTGKRIAARKDQAIKSTYCQSTIHPWFLP